MTAPLLPTMNASLNAIATVLLLGGWWAIKNQRKDLHRNFMIAALVASAAFLTCYLYYHFTVVGVTRYNAESVLRYVYYAILITHVPLATLMTPFILAAVWFAYRGRFDLHTRITKRLWPVWMYVSVTGVVIYLMLYTFGGGSHPPPA
jgi:putative membrane protein